MAEPVKELTKESMKGMLAELMADIDAGLIWGKSAKFVADLNRHFWQFGTLSIRQQFHLRKQFQVRKYYNDYGGKRG